MTAASSVHTPDTFKNDLKTMTAQVVMVKGYDEVAQHTNKLSNKHGISQMENIVLARPLAKEIAAGKLVTPK